MHGDMFTLCKKNGREKHRVQLVILLGWMIQENAMMLTIY